MAIVVVGGNGRGVGKTALVCGVVAALKEFEWTAIKVTTHAHSSLARIGEENAPVEETAAGQGTDTARYLAAGARRAFLVSALDAELGKRLRELEELVGPEANLIFESNRVLGHLRACVCLAIEPEPGSARKPSFALVEQEKRVTVRRAGSGEEEKFLPGANPVFQLKDFARIPASMQQWLRDRLTAGRNRQVRVFSP